MMPAEVLYRLLYLALIEIRAEGSTSGNKLLFHMADLYHHVPLQLIQVVQGESTYEDILAALRAQAQQKGVGEWLDTLIEKESRWTSENSTVDSAVLIHRLLRLALVDIRVEAYTTGNERVFCVADLCHNIPLQIERIAHGEETYDDVFAWLRNRAAQRGCATWLDQACQNITKLYASNVQG